jgi:hypothetical protein
VPWYAEGNVPPLRSSRPYAVPDLAVELARGDTLESPLLSGFELALDGLFGTDEIPT